MAAYVPARGDLIWLQFSPQAGHEQAGAVLGTAPDRKEAAEDERERADHRDRGDPDLVVCVVALRDQPHRSCRAEQRDSAGCGEDPPSHSKRSARLSPESSAFGMKPRAPLWAMRQP